MIIIEHKVTLKTNINAYKCRQTDRSFLYHRTHNNVCGINVHKYKPLSLPICFSLFIAYKDKKLCFLLKLKVHIREKKRFHNITFKTRICHL